MITPSFRIPYHDKLTDLTGYLSTAWVDFFRLLQVALDSIGVEKSSEIRNNQISPLDVNGLFVSSANVSQAIVEYTIQRVTIGTNPVELIESGKLELIYRPTQNLWQMFKTVAAGMNNTGVVLTITTAGQIRYTSTLVDGSPSISRIFFRIRTLSGKSKLYSAS